jgi:putative FmdB family regulatory protein
MPFYEYECDNCKFYTELLQKISDPPLKKCPSCGKNQMRKLVSAPVFRLKGGGWYETDFKSDKEGKRNLAVDKEPDSVVESKPAAKADSTDSKPSAEAKATESKPAESKPSEPKAEASGSRSRARPAAAAKSKSKSAAKVSSRARPQPAAKRRKTR